MIAMGDAVWQAATPNEVGAIFAAASFPWWIAGGFAIDHAVGRCVRPHGDIDVLIIRVDHEAVRSHLSDWDCWAADPPGILRPWAVGERLPARVSDVWCRPRFGEPWRLQLMLDDGDRETWRSRRCASVTLPVDELGTRGRDGIPYLRPEVQLYDEAKAPRPKDEIDLAAALPVLAPTAIDWLLRSIERAYGPDSPWVELIRTVTRSNDGTRRLR